MLINDLNIQNLLLLTTIPFWIILKNTFLFSFFLTMSLRFIILKSKILTKLFFITFLLIFTCYFKVVPIILVSVVFLGAYFFGLKIIQEKTSVISLVSGFFVLIQLYIIVGLIFGLKTGLLVIFIISIYLIINQLKKSNNIINLSHISIKQILAKFNFLDYWLIGLAFTIGSQPQTHWDAVHANLYNAKWYVLNNSFKPLPESISSLFPQNAIGYYSFFYQIGQEKMLQLSFIIPLLIILLITKKFIAQIKINKPLSLIFYLFIFSPIVVFESSNGYYDLLILSLLITALYLILFPKKENLRSYYLISSFFVGFASAIRYFPIIFILIPLINLLVFDRKIKNYILLIISMFFLAFFPLSIWLYRAFRFTNSPTFPFFQSIFPTPNLWTGTELASNFMIQTTMSLKQWISGGFLIYPFFTYFKTEQFMEATRSFSGLTYIFLIPIQFSALLKLIINLIRKKIHKIDLVLLCLLITYFCVGLFSRYYRYIWPFQFLLALVTILYFINTFKRVKIPLVLSLIFIFLILNINDTLGFFRFFALDLIKLGQPDYYQKTKQKNDPVIFLNNFTNYRHDIIILDASQYILPRLHFKGKVYECNWYWIEGIQKIKQADNNHIQAKKIIGKFDYIITSNPINLASNFCYQTIENNINELIPVYSDQNYLIFQPK